MSNQYIRQLGIQILTFYPLKYARKLQQHQILPGFFQQYVTDPFSHPLVVERYQKISLDKVYVIQTDDFSANINKLNMSL